MEVEEVAPPGDNEAKVRDASASKTYNIRFFSGPRTLVVMDNDQEWLARFTLKRRTLQLTRYDQCNNQNVSTVLCTRVVQSRLSVTMETIAKIVAGTP